VEGFTTSTVAGIPYRQTVVGYNTTTTAINAFQITASSGNLSTGTFSLYGVVE